MLIGLLTVVMALTSCTDNEGARRTLMQAGFTDIELTGYRFFMAGKEDTYCTGFKATSPNGFKVSGAVTGGPFKGNTIRFD